MKDNLEEKGHHTEKQPTLKLPIISNRRYNKNKQKLIEFEQNNHRYIILIPCSGNQNWYELSENSALIFYSEICLKQHHQTKFHIDCETKGPKYQIGYIRSLGYDAIKVRLEKANMYRTMEKRGDFIIFTLTKYYSDTELKQYLKDEITRREALISPMPVGFMNPDLMRKAIELSRALHQDCNRFLDQLYRTTNGVRIVNHIDQIILICHQIAFLKKTDSVRILAKLSEMRKHAYHLIIEIQLLAETSAIDHKRCATYGTLLIDIRDQIERSIKAYTKINNKERTSRK